MVIGVVFPAFGSLFGCVPGAANLPRPSQAPDLGLPDESLRSRSSGDFARGKGAGEAQGVLGLFAPEPEMAERGVQRVPRPDRAEKLRRGKGRNTDRLTAPFGQKCPRRPEPYDDDLRVETPAQVGHGFVNVLEMLAAEKEQRRGPEKVLVIGIVQTADGVQVGRNRDARGLGSA